MGASKQLVGIKTLGGTTPACVPASGINKVSPQLLYMTVGTFARHGDVNRSSTGNSGLWGVFFQLLAETVCPFSRDGVMPRRINPLISVRSSSEGYVLYKDCLLGDEAEEGKVQSIWRKKEYAAFHVTDAEDGENGAADIGEIDNRSVQQQNYESLRLQTSSHTQIKNVITCPSQRIAMSFVTASAAIKKFASSKSCDPR